MADVFPIFGAAIVANGARLVAREVGDPGGVAAYAGTGRGSKHQPGDEPLAKRM